MGACPTVMRVNLAQIELVVPMMGSHNPPSVYVGFMTRSLSSSKSKNNCPLFLLVWNEVCNSFRRLSHSFFLLNRYKSLKDRNVTVFFDQFIDNGMFRPFCFAWAIPNVDRIMKIIV